MSDNHSTAKGPQSKPAKPYPEFPLTAHPAGYWCKKIRGKIHYFGPWSDPDGALKNYEEQKDALHAGRTPRPKPDGLTVKQLVNDFLTHKRDLQNAGDLAPRTWADYKGAADLLIKHFGGGRLVDDLGPDDFGALRAKLAKKWGPVRVLNTIQRVRSIFKYAVDNGLVEKVVRYGQGFKRPSRKKLRLERASKGPKLFDREEILVLLLAAPVHLEPMILLGINCGFGNADCGTLPLSALNLDTGWVDFPRPKTGIGRRCPLWPETVAALREAIAKRPEPKDPAHAGLVFLTQRGLSWHKEAGVLRADKTPKPPDNPVSKEMRKLLNALGIDGHRNFYCLRHGFETIGGEAKDQVAVDHIMGHARDDMASVYREKISDERLGAVVDKVRTWLFAKPTDNGENAAEHRSAP
jgi:integrase